MNVFPYPGNKSRHSDWIISHLPNHECYVELFGGAAGVLFNKPRSKIEVYNDLNGDIPHFFRTLRDHGDELQDWLRNVPYSREVYDDWAADYYSGHRPDDDIERAGRFFALRYMQFGGKINGIAGYKSSAGGRSHARDLPSKVEKLHKFRERLRGVEIECADAFEVTDRHDTQRTVFYADPPYRGSEYQYDTGGFEHRELAEKAKQLEGYILVSYDDVPAYYGSSFNTASKDSSFAMSLGKDKAATEHLVMNFDADTETLMSPTHQKTLESI